MKRLIATGSPALATFDIQRGAWQELEVRPGVLVLGDIKRARGVVKKNAGASLVDLGDGVLCLEFHSKMTRWVRMRGTCSVPRSMRAAATSEPSSSPIRANHFSAGANLMTLLLAAQDGEWDELDAAVRRFQQANMALKYRGPSRWWQRRLG